MLQDNVLCQNTGLTVHYEQVWAATSFQVLRKGKKVRKGEEREGKGKVLVNWFLPYIRDTDPLGSLSRRLSPDPFPLTQPTATHLEAPQRKPGCLRRSSASQPPTLGQVSAESPSHGSWYFFVVLITEVMVCDVCLPPVRS